MSVPTHPAADVTKQHIGLFGEVSFAVLGFEFGPPSAHAIMQRVGVRTTDQHPALHIASRNNARSDLISQLIRPAPRKFSLLSMPEGNDTTQRLPKFRLPCRQSPLNAWRGASASPMHATDDGHGCRGQLHQAYWPWLLLER